MIQNFATIINLIERVKCGETIPPLRNDACRSKFFLHPHPTATVFLFLHGFTAGPYQFEPLGQSFFQSGHNVLVPLLPGHGLAGDWNGDRPPPLPTDPQVYYQFVRDWLQMAQLLGNQVIIGGLSTGATLAAWLALDQPQAIAHTLLFAPYLGNTYKVFDWLVKILPIYFEWFNKDAPGNFGYPGFCLPSLRLFLNMGQSVMDRAQNKQTAPVLIVSSEGDRVTDRRQHQALFAAVARHQPESRYYCFDKAFKIRHRMMTRVEGNEYQDWVTALAKAYVAGKFSNLELTRDCFKSGWKG